jgi:hypothetical protein
LVPTNQKLRNQNLFYSNFKLQPRYSCNTNTQPTFPKSCKTSCFEANHALLFNLKYKKIKLKINVAINTKEYLKLIQTPKRISSAT